MLRCFRLLGAEENMGVWQPSAQRGCPAGNQYLEQKQTKETKLESTGRGVGYLPTNNSQRFDYFFEFLRSLRSLLFKNCNSLEYQPRGSHRGLRPFIPPTAFRDSLFRVFGVLPDEHSSRAGSNRDGKHRPNYLAIWLKS